MPLSSLMKDRVTIVKTSGERFENLQASVQKGRVFMSGTTPLVEPGDTVVCRRSNGAEESFRVIDPGFHEQHGGIPAGYQMHVEKLGLPQAATPGGSVSYVFHGANSRVNLHSVDQSLNIAQGNDALQAALQRLDSAIESAQLHEEARREAKELADSVKAQCQSGKPSRAVVGALVKALPAVEAVAKAGTAVLGLLGAAGA